MEIQRERPTARQIETVHDAAQRLQQVVAALQTRYGSDVLRDATALPTVIPPHIASGYAPLDALTGCGGLPQGHLSLFTGGATSGRLSCALRFLTAARSRSHDSIVVFDPADSIHSASLQRAGVDSAHTLFVRPSRHDAPAALLGDLLNTHTWRCVLIDGLHRLRSATFDAALPELTRLARRQRTALLLLDDAASSSDEYAGSALAHHLSLHLHFERTHWLRRPYVGLCGFAARVRLERSRWARPGGHCDMEIPL